MFTNMSQCSRAGQRVLARKLEWQLLQCRAHRAHSSSPDHLLIGVVGGLQPDKLAKSFEGPADGMYARLLFSWPSDPAYRPLNDEALEVDPDILNALKRLDDLAEFADGRLVRYSIGLLECVGGSSSSFGSLRTSRRRPSRAGIGSGSPRDQRMCCVLPGPCACSTGPCAARGERRRLALMPSTWSPLFGSLGNTSGPTRGQPCGRSASPNGTLTLSGCCAG